MKSLYDEILEEKQRSEAESAARKLSMRNAEAAAKIARKSARNQSIKRGIKFLLIIGVAIFVVFGYIIPTYNMYKNHKDYGSQTMDPNTHDIIFNGQPPIDHYPDMPALVYGRAYMRAGVWYKYFPHELDGTYKSFNIIPDHYQGQPIFHNCQLSNGFRGVMVTKSDSVTVTH